MTAATHAWSSTLQPSSQTPSCENWQSSEHTTGAGYMGALAGLNGGNGGMGGAGTEGGEGGSTLTSPHRSFGALKNAWTSSIVPPTYTLGLPFSDSPVISSKVFCTAPAKPRARICRPAVERLSARGGLPRLHQCSISARTCSARPESSIRLSSARTVAAASMAILSPPWIGLCCPSESSSTNFRTPGRPPWRSKSAAACSAADIDVEPAGRGGSSACSGVAGVPLTA